MGTIQDPNPDREWLRRSYVDTSTNPYSIDARTEMMGRLAEGTGGRRAARAVVRAAAAVILLSFAVSFVVGVLRLL
jgi:hypothetical protein